MSLEDGDVLLLNATVIDGCGSKPRFKASLIVRKGYIHSFPSHIKPEEIDKAQNSGIRVVDCNDGKYVVSPGFIDMWVNYQAENDFFGSKTDLFNCKACTQ